MYLNKDKSQIYYVVQVCLTLTWDVFKFNIINASLLSCVCLTLTWDVFK